MLSLEELTKTVKSLNETKEYQQVIDCLPDELLKFHNDADLYAEKGQAYFRLGKIELSADIIDKTLSININHVKANYFKGALHSNYKQYDIALKFLNKAIDLDPYFPMPYNGKGNIYRDLRQYEQAIDAYNKAIELDSKFAYPWNGLGILHHRLKQYDQAIDAFNKAIELDPKYAAPHNGLGNIYQGSQQYFQAIDAFMKAIKLDPKLAYPWNGLGNINRDLKKYDQAIDAYNKAIELDSRLAYPWNGLGNINRDLKKYDQAIDAYNKAIEIDPKYPSPYNGLGNTYRDLKKYDLALDAYYKVIEIDPKYLYSYNGLGNIYRDLKKYDLAIDFYNKAIEIDPKYPYPYNGLGNTYRDLKKYDQAIDAYNKAIEIDPKYHLAYYNSAIAYFDSDQYEKALISYKKYVELTKNSPDYFTSQAKFRISEITKLIENADYSKISDLVNQIKNLLLFRSEFVTHYTSMSVAKILILERGALRLSEGAYLNDTSEGRELFNYLSFHITPRSGDDTIAEPFAQKPFIGSFVSDGKNDDLTLWRMYGKEAKEEARGCAITLHKTKFLQYLKEKMITGDNTDNSLTNDKDFCFYRVAYRKNDRKKQFTIPSAQNDEEALNNYMTELKQQVSIYKTNKGNKLLENRDIMELLNEISFLFKTAEYEYEHEIRLVIKGIGFLKHISKDLTPPRVFIDLISINPVIQKITLGPKVERSDEWAAALYYVLDKDDHHPEILISHLPFK